MFKDTDEGQTRTMCQIEGCINAATDWGRICKEHKERLRKTRCREIIIEEINDLKDLIKHGDKLVDKNPLDLGLVMSQTKLYERLEALKAELENTSDKQLTKEELYFMWKEAQHMVDNAVKQIVRFTGGTISEDDIREGLK
jgi:hypothetical protein